MKKMKLDMELGILLLNLFIAFLGIGLVIPVLPSIMNELHISGSTVGYLVAAFAMMQLVVSPFAGKWADKYGRKRMIVIGLLLFSLSELVFGLGKVVEVLFLSRLLGGVSAAFIMPAVTAYIADITTLDERPRALGYMSAAISTGFIIGPGIGGFLAEISIRTPFFVAAIFALIAAILSLITLKEPKRQKAKASAEHVSGMKRVFSPLYFIAFMVIFISTFGLSAFESLFSLFVDHKYGFQPKDIAIIITGGALIGAVAQVVLFNRLMQWLGEKKLILYCFVFSAIFTFFMTVVSAYFAILLVTVFVFVGFDLLRPAVTTYLSRVAEDEQGFVGGMNSMFTSIGNILGPIIGGRLFDIHLDFPFHFATLFLVIGIILCLIWIGPKRNRKRVVQY